ncbi:MAG: hypothetical protein PHZ19_00260 [Candidatus Thermoplasmatota archaeon]|nr:hypothetical protein [Candidatus Thermoplasmatota archaeon]
MKRWFLIPKGSLEEPEVQTVGKKWFRRTFKWKIVREDGVVVARLLEVHKRKDGSIQLHVQAVVDGKSDHSESYYFTPAQAQELRGFLNQ